MPWNYDDEEINGIVDANLKDSPPNPPAVNTAASIRNMLKSYWSAIRGQVAGAVAGFDLLSGEISDQVLETLDTVETRVSAAEAKADSIFDTFSLADSIGEFNATTGVATVTATGATSTPGAVPAFANGKYLDVVVAGNTSITGTVVAAAVGGRFIVRENKWGYIPPGDRSMILSKRAINFSGIATDQIANTYRDFNPTLHERTLSTGAATTVGNGTLTYDDTTGNITVVGFTDSSTDSIVEYWESDFIVTASQKISVEITVGASKTANPFYGFGVVGGMIPVYRVDGTLGYLNRAAGTISSVSAALADRALVAGDVVKITMKNIGTSAVAIDWYKNGVWKFGFAAPNSLLAGKRILLATRGSGDTVRRILTEVTDSSSVVKTTVKSAEAKYVKKSVNLLPKNFVASYWNSVGASLVDATWLRSSQWIQVDPLTQYTLLGIDSIFPGDEYQADGTFVKNIAPSSTPYTSITFTTDANTRLLGVNIRSNGRPDTTNTAMLVKGNGVGVTYEEYDDTFVDAGKIKGGITSEQVAGLQADITGVQTGLATTNSKIVSVLTTGKNLLDPASAIVGDSYYTFSSGAIGLNTNWRRFDYLNISAVPDGQWINIQGIATDFVGNLYDGAHARVATIGGNTGLKTFFSVQKPTGAVYLGINYQSNGRTANPLTAMVWTSATEQFKPTLFEDYFTAAYKTPASKVYGSTDLAPIYFEFNPTAGASAAGQFKVYARFPNTNLYNCYLVEHVVDAGIRADLWRIRGANVYTRLSNGTMAIDSAKPATLFSSENELAYQIKAASDHTGGYHGDEVLSFVQFFADGSPISIGSAIALTACDEFFYVQRADTYNPGDASPTPTAVAAHTKRTTFSGGAGYRVNNALEIKIPVTLISTYAGLTCTGLGMAGSGGYYYSKKLQPVAVILNDAFNLNETDDRDGEVTYYNPTTRLGCRITSQFKKVKMNGVDATEAFLDASSLSVWDRTTDTKYYHRIFNSDRVFAANDYIESEMIVRAFYGR